jgi:hypothetical protein
MSSDESNDHIPHMSDRLSEEDSDLDIDAVIEATADDSDSDDSDSDGDDFEALRGKLPTHSHEAEPVDDDYINVPKGPSSNM